MVQVVVGLASSNNASEGNGEQAASTAARVIAAIWRGRRMNGGTHGPSAGSPLNIETLLPMVRAIQMNWSPDPASGARPLALSSLPARGVCRVRSATGERDAAMIDQPGTEALLAAMAATIRSDMIPSLTGGSQHSARVVANLCDVLSREAAADPADAEEGAAALAELLGEDGSFADLVGLLDVRLATSDANFDRAAHELLLADATRRLRVARPSYVEEG